MNCKYCGTSNLADDQRCTRCGRKLNLTAANSVADLHRPYALAYKAVESAEEADTGSVAVEIPVRSAPPGPGRQSALFQTTDKPRVVPIFGPHITSKPAVPKPQQAPLAQRRTAGHSTIQQQLTFGPVAPRRQTEVESEIYCSAPVATTQHRAFAAFIDCGIVLTAFALLTGIFFVWGSGSIESDPVSLSIVGGVALLVIAFYQILWVLANGNTAGMRIAQLTLVNFDGRRPDRKQRFVRVAAAWLSIAPGALGLFWALVDEEKLTWHDQISKTFPSPRD